MSEKKTVETLHVTLARVPSIRRSEIEIGLAGKRLTPQNMELLSLYGAKREGDVIRITTSPETALALGILIEGDLFNR